ncbi:hypothetical protein V6N13_086438 [Hibiscus sabdariffa]
MPTLLWYRCNFKSFRDVVNEARALFWKLAGLELCMRLRKTVFYYGPSFEPECGYDHNQAQPRFLMQVIKVTAMALVVLNVILKSVLRTITL